MKRKKPRLYLSAGTVFMLLFTVLVVLGCAGFLYMITGEDVAVRATDILSSFTFAKEPQSTQAPQEPTGRAAMPAALFATAVPPLENLQPEPSATPVPEKITLSIAAVGAVYAPKAVRQTVQTGGDQYDFAPVFEQIAPVLGDADLTIATLETMTAGSEKGYDNYNTPVQILDALRACGVDLVSLATERALDKDHDGLTITMQEVARRGLSYAGVYPEAGNAAVSMGSIGGVQVAVLAYTYGLSDEGEKKTAASSQDMVAMMDIDRIRSDIAAARQQGAKLVIVLPHWGTKNKTATPESVTQMAREMARAGADIVLGTHPNVVQGTERIVHTRADGLEYETLVCYSLGSLLTDARTQEHTASMAVRLEATYDPVTRRVELGQLDVTPLYIARTRVDEKIAYRVVPADDAQALDRLEETERMAAQQAAQLVRQMVIQEERQ